MRGGLVQRFPKQRIDGVLLLDKAEGISSNYALQQVKRLFAAEKAGHTGTLDPFASGLLPICFGEATKFSSFALEADKRYEARMCLGVTTDTGDRDGHAVERRAVDVTEAQIEHALAGLRGQIKQTPPMYSALKKNGKALYEYAREGIEVERVEREVTIHCLVLLARSDAQLDITVTCSKGTYIRTLAEQIGAALGCGAHLSGLRRTASGAFKIDTAVSFELLAGESEAARAARLLPVDALAAALPRLDLQPAQAAAIAQGRAVPYEAQLGFPGRAGLEGHVLARAYLGGRFLGVVRADRGELRAQRLLSQVPAARDGPPSSSARDGPLNSSAPRRTSQSAG